MAHQRNGKIARLPHALREEVNRRLLDGVPGSQILDWINAEPAAVKVFADYFNGAPVNDQNLTNWRTDGYRDWIRKNEKVEHLKTLSSYAHQVAKAGGKLSEGAQAIVAGELLEVLEAAVDFDDGETDPIERLGKLTNAIASLRHVDLAQDRIELDRQKTKLKAEAQKLDREKFETLAVGKFMEWAKSDEATRILESGKPRDVQMGLLREMMFGKEEAA